MDGGRVETELEPLRVGGCGTLCSFVAQTGFADGSSEETGLEQLGQTAVRLFLGGIEWVMAARFCELEMAAIPNLAGFGGRGLD